MDGLGNRQSQFDKLLRSYIITLREYQVIRRLRQLQNEGAPRAIVELGERGPQVCKVGKPEG